MCCSWANFRFHACLGIDFDLSCFNLFSLKNQINKLRDVQIWLKVEKVLALSFCYRLRTRDQGCVSRLNNLHMQPNPKKDCIPSLISWFDCSNTFHVSHDLTLLWLGLIIIIRNFPWSLIVDIATIMLIWMCLE